ncbi:hypothetical protein Vqi01_12650 [Micromonospora qiuiae]|uniref:Secreted protein n=1 Tax=Micromonospora qiuiae TaxID=502268 RepID=A0ABQ4J7R4_9ACTN|nr:hypothetical protein [Micromonospora qiuiae]GIJ26103.1 hypothetical protein Vqi01_12650 [Micromonospora qiuiae]
MTTTTSVRSGRRPARAALAAATAVVTASALAILPASPASAEPAHLNDCRTNARASYVDVNSWLARGNYTDAWRAPYGIRSGDALQISATGTTRIDYWGANKNVEGDPHLAPAGWPLPGERQYMLMGRLTTGYVWHDARNRYYEPEEWFPVGANSGCLGIVRFSVSGTPKLQLGINDPNIGDNGGGPYVTVRQWW